MTLSFTLESADGTTREESVELVRAFNFGYAGRSRAAVESHVEELRELGFPAPDRTPSIYPISPALVTPAESIVVRGDATYGEVEFVLVLGDGGWRVGIASDHSDMTIEQVSTARAKTLYPDVVSQGFWSLDEVTDHWDELTLLGERDGGDGWKVIQSDSVASLMSPLALIEELASRSGSPASPGTALVSGTIGGEILPGAAAWRNTLSDPVLGRSLTLEYRVIEEPIEL